MDIKLDGETANRVTVLTLTQHRDWLKEDIKDPKLHDEDRGRNLRLVQAMDILLSEYFGDIK